MLHSGDHPDPNVPPEPGDPPRWLTRLLAIVLGSALIAWQLSSYL